VNDVVDPLVTYHRFLLLIAVALGGLVGSFLNVVAHRLPAGRSVVHPPSACPRCEARIRPWHNVPVLGWVFLGGKCRDCALPISPRYPAVELANAVLWGVLFVVMVPEPSVLLEPARIAGFVLYGAYFSALLAACLIDADHFILPDVIVLPLIPLGWLAVAWLDGVGASSLPFPSAVLGAVGGTLALLAIAFAGRLAFGREAMGMGDVKLVAAIGAWQGLHPTLLLTIFGASLLGSVVGIGAMVVRGRDRPAKLPFGPYLAGAALVSWLAGERILAAILPSFT